MIRHLLVIILASFLISCKGLNSFYTHDRFQREIRSSYERDTLYLSDYFICSHQRQMTLFNAEYQDRLAEPDSILGIFQDKINNLGLITVKNRGKDLSDSNLCHREQVKMKHIINHKGNSLGLVKIKDNTVILPFFQITDLYRFTGYMTSGLVAGDDGFMNFTSVSLIVFIIKNGEVIYSDHRRYASKRTMANSLEEVRAIPPAYQIREEHIEELVRRAMKRYVKRLER